MSPESTWYAWIAEGRITREGWQPVLRLSDKMETLDAGKVEGERDEDFEEHIWDQLQQPGKLKWENTDDATRGKVLRVALDAKQDGPSTASFYNRLRALEPKVLTGEPQYLGLWVHGNSSWARITFELVDAEGETWSNIGAAAENGLAAWNTNDTESTTFVNFDGWRQLAVALPGQYPFDNYHWPRNCNWRHRGGNGLVDYPLKLTALVLEMRERIVYIDELVETTSRSLLLGELRAGKAHVE